MSLFGSIAGAITGAARAAAGFVSSLAGRARSAGRSFASGFSAGLSGGGGGGGSRRRYSGGGGGGRRGGGYSSGGGGRPRHLPRRIGVSSIASSIGKSITKTARKIKLPSISITPISIGGSITKSVAGVVSGRKTLPLLKQMASITQQAQRSALSTTQRISHSTISSATRIASSLSGGGFIPSIDRRSKVPVIGPGGEAPTRPGVDFKGREPTVLSSMSVGATRAVKDVGETVYGAIGGAKREVEGRISGGISTIGRVFSPKTMKRAAVMSPVIGAAPIVGPAALGIGAATYAARKAYGKLQSGGTKPRRIGVHDITMGYIPLSKRGIGSTKSRKESKPLPSLSDVFAPTRAHFGLVGFVAGRGEREYHERITRPIETFIGGKRERALAEQQEKIQHLGEKVKKYEKPEWRTEEGIVLPTEPTSEVKAWQQKWSPLIKGDKFLGTEAQYQQYIKGFHKYYKKRGDNQYVLREEYSRLTPEAQRYEQSLRRHEKERWFGVPYKIQSLEKKISPFMKKFIPPVTSFAEVKTPEDWVKAVKETSKWQEKYWGKKPTKEEEKALIESYGKGQKAYGTYRRMWGLPSEPFEWEKKAAQITAGEKAGRVEEIREHPVKGAVTTAIFAILPSVLKGTGTAWRAAGLATKFPRVTKIAPKATGIIMSALGVGYGAEVGHEIYKAPTLVKKGEVIGRTEVELAEMGIGSYLGIKLPGGISGGFRGLKTRLTREKIPIEKITTPEVATGKTTLLHAPKGTTPKELVQQFKTTEKVFGLPGEKYGEGVKVWRAAPVEYGPETVVRRGEYAMPGMYVSPGLSPHFLRIKPPKTEISLFGIDIPESIPAVKPTAYRITIKDVTRIPGGVRKTDIPSIASWFMGKGEVGKGHISSEFEIGKTEAEAVLPVTTGLKKTRGKYYTVWRGKAVPIEEMEVFETGMPRVPIGSEKGKFYVKRPRGTAIIETEKGIILHKGERGEGYILPGGEIETAAVKGLKGIKAKGESALEGTIREIYEELGLKPSKSRYLFKQEGSDIALYSLPGGRQRWWSKNIYSVFEFKTRGRPKLKSREVKDIIYYKPGMKVKLSKDTEAILKRYYKLKETKPSSKPSFKDITAITKRIEKERKTKVSKEKKGTTTVEKLLKEEEYLTKPRKVSLVSPFSLGTEYTVSSIVRKPGKVRETKILSTISSIIGESRTRYPKPYKFKERYPLKRAGEKETQKPYRTRKGESYPKQSPNHEKQGTPPYQAPPRTQTPPYQAPPRTQTPPYQAPPRTQTPPATSKPPVFGKTKKQRIRKITIPDWSKFPELSPIMMPKQMMGKQIGESKSSYTAYV